jgi:hypothetical protein
VRLPNMQLPTKCDATSAPMQASLAEIVRRRGCRIRKRVNLFFVQKLFSEFCQAAANVRFGITAEGLYQQLAHGN